MVGYYTIPRTPSSVLTTLTCDSIRPGQQNRNPSFFWDRRVDAQIAQALKMQITDPDAAVRVWAGLESELVGLAPGCRSTRRGSSDLVSKRVGNYQYNPTDQILNDQLWLR
jgi:peptide/nickel transport system substrate-binding protein